MKSFIGSKKCLNKETPSSEESKKPATEKKSKQKPQI